LSRRTTEGTTHAAIENGTVVVLDTANQTQDIATLSRDTENANGSIDAIFDKEKEMRRMEEAQLIAEIGMQVADIARTQGEIAKQEAMKDPAALSAAEEKLRAEGKSNPTPQEIADQAGRKAMEQYGTGSDMHRAIQAATAAVQGLAGGDMTAALAGAAAPYVAEIIGHRMGLEKEGKEAEKAAAHAVANAVLAAMQGEDALAGAAGALAGELAGAIALEMYGKDFNKLDETEKQTISALATLAAGIAGSVAGDGTASAIAGAEAGKTVVENNYLNPSSFGQGMMGYGLAAQSWNKFAEENGLSIEEKMAGMDKLVNGEKPSWGAEYKVKPYVKGEVAGGAGAGYYFDASIDPNQISANRGETLAVGGRISGQMGIQFGPYLPGIITSERNNSIGLGFGLISGGILYGKDGVGFSIGVGPAWGWSGISTNIANEKIDINGSSGTEFYNYNFGQEKTK